ncbi:MAG: alpha/beta hydrolase [Hespellia sp.]|nr:alpha/beta hydrolase [Hespellia sp.]
MLHKKDLQLTNEFYDKHATVYYDTNIVPRAAILYFHGGGLLYGSRKDLPELHLRTLTNAGFVLIAYDYPLAPAAKVDLILNDVCQSIQDYCKNNTKYTDSPLPYFLWGRSAGAYLCLLAAASGSLAQPPLGLLSYYGYGFLCDNWFNQPSPYYCTLPQVPGTCLSKISSELHASGSLDTHYSAYVYARQSGKWLSQFFEGREKHFYLNFTLRLCEKMPCPLFCAHSTGDTDVPFAEFTELTNRYNPTRFVASGSVHDFDRDETSDAAIRLLDATVNFLNSILE